MTIDRDLDRQLSHFLEAEAMATTSDDLLARSLARVDATPQRPGWLVRDRGRRPNGAIRQRLPWHRSAVLVTAIAVLVGAVVVGPRLLTIRPIAGGDSPAPPPSSAVASGPLASSEASSSASEPATSTSPSTPPGAAPLGGRLILAYGPDDGSKTYPVYAIDAGTGGRTLLGTVPQCCYGGRVPGYTFQWSADGSRALLVNHQGGIHALDAPTAAASGLQFACCVTAADSSEWTLSPNGNSVAGLHTSSDAPFAPKGLGVGDAILVAPATGGSVRTLSLPGGAVVDGPISWSPDGTAIVAAGCRPCNFADVGATPSAVQHQHLFIVPVDGSGVRELLDLTGVTFGSPAWSPAGTAIAIDEARCKAGEVPPYCSSGGTTLVSVAVTDGRTITLAATTDGVSPAEWAPDGRRIAVTDGGHLIVVDADGANKVTTPGSGGTPHWSPDGAWLLYTESSDVASSTAKVYVVAADGGTPRLLGTYGGAEW